MDKIPVKKDSASMTNLPLTPAELKFIFRIRQLRKMAVQSVVVTMNPLSISVLGQAEALENPASGEVQP